MRPHEEHPLLPPPHPPPEHRMGPPRGILRYLTLLILRRRPMAGSELTDEIKGYTGWKPSPGSMYPMLSDLEKEGLIKPLQGEYPRLKRYTITERGIKSLEGYRRLDEHFKKQLRMLMKIYWRLHQNMPEDLYKSLASLIHQVEDTYLKIAGNREKSKRLIKILEGATEHLSALCKEEIIPDGGEGSRTTQ